MSPDISAWEAAYLRFETPQEEIHKFIQRLRTLGADKWSRDARILELFCGRGNGMVALEQLGFTRVQGVDLSPRLIGEYLGPAYCMVGDCRALPIRAESQDVAIVQGGLHHLPTLPGDLEHVIKEVKRVLKPKGLFIVVEPWRTPFLNFVHRAADSRVARRLWGKLDAFQTMFENERETYLRWLSEPALVSTLLSDHFEPQMKQERWGKLLFAGHKR